MSFSRLGAADARRVKPGTIACRPSEGDNTIALYPRVDVIVSTPPVFDLNQVVAEAEYLFVPIVGKSIRLALRLEPEAVHVRIERARLEQALTHLVRNAAAASQTDGVVRITTRRRGERALVIVSDAGCGMDDETRRRAFQPFFSGKAGYERYCKGSWQRKMDDCVFHRHLEFTCNVGPLLLQRRWFLPTVSPLNYSRPSY